LACLSPNRVLLFTTGASSVQPVAMMGNAGPGAGLRNYALTLHQALAADGIYAAASLWTC
jgi:hypothetical protein